MLSDPGAGQPAAHQHSRSHALRRVVTQKGAGNDAAQRLEFRDPPRVELTATGRSFADPAGLNVKGQLTLGRTRYRGQGIEPFPRGLDIRRVIRSARATSSSNATRASARRTPCVYDLEHGMTCISTTPARNLEHLGEVGVWLDPDVYHTIAPFHFHKPPDGDDYQRQRAVQRRARVAPRHAGQCAGRDGFYTFIHKNARLSEHRRARSCSPRTGCGSTTCAARFSMATCTARLDLVARSRTKDYSGVHRREEISTSRGSRSCISISTVPRAN